jgi:hypothetical protein
VMRLEHPVPAGERPLAARLSTTGEQVGACRGLREFERGHRRSLLSKVTRLRCALTRAGVGICEESVTCLLATASDGVRLVPPWRRNRRAGAPRPCGPSWRP